MATNTTPNTPTAEVNEQPESLEITHLDDDRDIVVDFMEEATPKRTIYRQVLKEWSTRYRFVKRGEKTKIVKHIVNEMKKKGVRFWVRDHRLAHFGLRVVMVREDRKIKERVQRCIREQNRKLYGSSQKSGSGTASLAPSFSAASNGSTIRTKESISPPVMQVNVPSETEEKTTNAFPVPMEVMTKSFRTSSTSDSATSVSSIHEVSVASNTKNTPAETSQKEMVVPAPPNLDRALSPPPPLPHLLATQDSLFMPPQLERHTESWCSLIQHCYPDLQELMNEGEANISAEVDVASATAISQNDHLSAKRPRENEGLIDSDEESRAAQRYRATEDTPNNSMPNVVNSTPIWVHMSRHLTVLEQRLELVERDNLALRRRLAKCEANNDPTPNETNDLLHDQAITLFAHI